MFLLVDRSQRHGDLEEVTEDAIISRLCHIGSDAIDISQCGICIDDDPIRSKPYNVP